MLLFFIVVCRQFRGTHRDPHVAHISPFPVRSLYLYESAGYRWMTGFHSLHWSFKESLCARGPGLNEGILHTRPTRETPISSGHSPAFAPSVPPVSGIPTLPIDARRRNVLSRKRDFLVPPDPYNAALTPGDLPELSP